MKRRVRLTASTKDLQTFVLGRRKESPIFGAQYSLGERTRPIGIAAKGLASKKQRTFEYWWQVRDTLLCQQSSQKGRKRLEVIQGLEALAKSLDDLPTVGVDRDAVDFAVEAAKGFQRLADRNKDRDDPDRLLEAFVRGLAGDPFDAVTEEMDRDKKIGGELRALPEQFREPGPGSLSALRWRSRRSSERSSER